MSCEGVSDGVDRGPAVPVFAFRPGLGREPLPGVLREAKGKVNDPTGTDPDDDLVVLRDRQDVPEVGLAQVLAQFRVRAVSSSPATHATGTAPASASVI